jgi:hypothetical protein
MGHEMSALLLAAAALTPAVGAQVFYSSDGEDSEVVKAAIDFDLRYVGPEHRLGVSVERARYRPLGTDARTMARVFLRASDSISGWKWEAKVGTDGETVIGSASIHDESRFRKEVFVERDVVETPIGVNRGLYYTFAGAAIDLPADDRNVVTLVAGVQPFTGGNVRTHLRATYVHVLKPDWGLSAQLRTRWYHSSDPGQYDYYSPRWYAEVLPVVQMRRFVGGWQLLGAVGYGAQRDSQSDWRSSRYVNARVTSPRFRKDWSLNANFTYANTPVSTGFTYRYLQLSIGLTKAL